MNCECSSTSNTYKQKCFNITRLVLNGYCFVGPTFLHNRYSLTPELNVFSVKNHSVRCTVKKTVSKKINQCNEPE